MRKGRSPVIKKSIVDYIQRYVAEHGFSPSIRDIVSAVGLSSTSVANAYIKELVEDGVVNKAPAKSRALEVVGYNRPVELRSQEIPIIKGIGQGGAFLSEDNIAGVISIPLREHTDNKSFAIVVKDDGMSGSGISMGDIVIAGNPGVAEDGDIVVCFSGNKLFIRTLYTDGNNISLVSDIERMDNIRPDEVSLMGVVSTVIHYKGDS